MGILDFLFGDKKRDEPLKVTNASSALSEEYENLKTKTEKLQAENQALENEFDHIISSHQKAQQLEKENRFGEAIYTYLQSIEKGENS